MRGFDLVTDPAFKQLGKKRAGKLRGAKTDLYKPRKKAIA
jgi:hypothetical protein